MMALCKHLESEASQQGVFAEKPAKSIAASSFHTHKITTWMVLIFRLFFRWINSPNCISVWSINREEMAGIKMGMGTGKGEHICVLLVLRNAVQIQNTALHQLLRRKLTLSQLKPRHEALRLSRHKGREMPSVPKGAV